MTMLDQTLVAIIATHAPQQRRRCWTCEHEIWVPGHPAFPPDPGCPEWQPALATPTYEEAR